MRLGENEFADLLGPTVFLKKEHELKLASDTTGIVTPFERKKHAAAEIAAKWAQIKVMRDLDVARLMQKEDVKLVTNEDWMIATLLALIRQKKEPITTVERKNEKDMNDLKESNPAAVVNNSLDEEVKNADALPTGDSTKTPDINAGVA